MFTSFTDIQQLNWCAYFCENEVETKEIVLGNQLWDTDTVADGGLLYD